ncbi:sugar MFS transporter [Alistipes megaguti]|uniref:sugar MFS transporter n=1 Tax=Alistipes megaguti TaxID=2364787 RepID=UPI000EFBB264|nr:sugar MFS transporter [Alistipes megaguti]
MQPKRQYYFSLAMLGCLFFIFGLVSWVNSILVPYFKVACELTSGVETYLVTFAFYIAYLVMTVPASFLLRRVGYKRGTLIGLWIMAAGALLFWPAALTRTYGLFLTALFTIGTALAILQSVANPFVTIIGPHESAAKRISMMGICNKLAGIIAPLLFAFLVIRPEDKQIMESIEQGLLSGEALQEALNEMIRGVIVPYVVLAILLFLFGILFYKSPIQDINPDKDNRTTGSQNDRKSIWSYPYLILGVAALFAHLGSQQISVSTIIGYAQGMGMSLDAAQIFPSCTLGCILLGYLGGVILIPRYISQQQSLVICTIAGLVLSTLVLILPPRASIWSLVLLGVPNSLIYAGIWPLAIRGLGRFTSLGSSLLVMALCGNAVLSLLYGLISDHMSLQASYWLLIPCFVYMIFYAIYGYKIEKW